MSNNITIKYSYINTKGEITQAEAKIPRDAFTFLENDNEPFTLEKAQRCLEWLKKNNNQLKWL